MHCPTEILLPGLDLNNFSFSFICFAGKLCVLVSEPFNDQAVFVINAVLHFKLMLNFISLCPDSVQIDLSFSSPEFFIVYPLGKLINNPVFLTDFDFFFVAFVSQFFIIFQLLVDRVEVALELPVFLFAFKAAVDPFFLES